MKTRTSLKSASAVAAAVLLATSGPVLADEPTVTYKFGGYAKFDAMFTEYSDFTPGGNDLIRQFYWAPGVPVNGYGDADSSDDWTADFQGRETRLNFRADAKTEGGSTITAFVEMDFFTDADGNEVVSNSYKPRLRHAFIKYNKWTFGQTWSTFQDVAALPEALDFVGPAESTTFIRQAMIRYTSGPFEIAVENPEEWMSGDYTARGYSTMPDLIGRYTFSMDGGSYIKVAGLLRNIKTEETDGGSQLDETAWGISVSTKIMIGNGDLRAMVTHGDGVGRYIGLGFVRDGYTYDTVLGDDTVVSSFDTAEATAAFVAYRFNWSDKWRSNIMYGTTSIDYDDNLRAGQLGLNDEGSSFHFNVIHSILPKLDIGAEIIWGERVQMDTFFNEIVGAEVPTKVDGDFTRIMISAKYAF
jgi:hypothetical protein